MSSIIHDLRNKLNVIIMNSGEIAKDESLPELTRALATDIFAAATETMTICDAMTALLLEQRVAALEERVKELRAQLARK